MSAGYILAIDQGTTSSRAILFDSDENIAGIAQKEFTQHFPEPGRVEHDALEIWESQLAVVREVLKHSGIPAAQVRSIGITNQRETTVVWDRHTGIPVAPAIVWQDRRTAPFCHQLREEGHEPLFQERTGLILDAYFSGTKIRWILDNTPGARAAAEAGDLLFGTVDAWLTWKLTGGKVHATDASNASRTLLFNIHTLSWDKELCRILDIPPQMLPEVKDSAADFGQTAAEWLGVPVPIGGVAGDQQAALFGQGCLSPGMAKNTYGTGCFMLMNTGGKPVPSTHGLLSTVAWKLNGKAAYALEGSVFIAGAAIQWLRDGLGIIRSAEDTEKLARSVKDTAGVYFVPAFAGLGAPYWDMEARGLISGLTRGTTAAHIVRAALESLAYQTCDILRAMEKDAGMGMNTLKVDGGAARNDFLMQFQADILQVLVSRPHNTETTALGAARLAGISAGIFRVEDFMKEGNFRSFRPVMHAGEAGEKYAGWQQAVRRSFHEK